jgi:hypothetical protein
MPISPDLLGKITHPKVRSGEWTTPYQGPYINWIPFNVEHLTPTGLAVAGALHTWANMEFDPEEDYREAMRVSPWVDSIGDVQMADYSFVFASKSLAHESPGIFPWRHQVDLTKVFKPEVEPRGYDCERRWRRRAQLSFPKSKYGGFLTTDQLRTGEVTEKDFTALWENAEVEPFLFHSARKPNTITGEDLQRCIVTVTLADGRSWLTKDFGESMEERAERIRTLRQEVRHLETENRGVSYRYARALDSLTKRQEHTPLP